MLRKVIVARLLFSSAKDVFSFGGEANPLPSFLPCWIKLVHFSDWPTLF